MVLAPFFFALGALGGGLFVASPCVGVFAFVSARAVCGDGVCVWAGANGAAVRGNVCGAGVSVPQRAGALRRFAEALRGGRRGPAAPPPPSQTPLCRIRSPAVSDAVAHQNCRHDVCYCCSAAPLLCRRCGAVRRAFSFVPNYTGHNNT